MFDINVEKKNTIARRISSFNRVKKRAHKIRWFISIPFSHNTARKRRDCKTTINIIVAEKPKNFPKIKSCLLIGLESIKKIVFPSISLNNNWLQTKSTPISPKISIIPRPKSTITLCSLFPIVRPQRANEKIINTNAKNRIRYKNLFLTISLKVFLAMFNMTMVFWKIFFFFASVVSF